MSEKRVVSEGLVFEQTENNLKILCDVESGVKNRLLKLVIQSDVIKICGECFSCCPSLFDMVFEYGSQLTCIEEHVFEGSGLKKIQIPSSVEFLGKDCFSQCKSLCELTFESGLVGRVTHGELETRTGYKCDKNTIVFVTLC
jgi:hypothetical protein